MNIDFTAHPTLGTIAAIAVTAVTSWQFYAIMVGASAGTYAICKLLGIKFGECK